ncbi:PP0621 family protein [Campylobacter sp. RM16190]|uniref:PP0621 family protein n=1 Tax=Campylobacter sp. RM16190 TaxID=1705727 RepID=UPI0014747426|nr:PP0621 family protein [Campylobacter sp. RM16190]
MAKILVFIVVLIVIYIFFFKSRKKHTKSKDVKEIENFVECSKCGTFVEVKEAILSSTKYVCKDCVRNPK